MFSRRNIMENMFLFSLLDLETKIKKLDLSRPFGIWTLIWLKKNFEISAGFSCFSWYFRRKNH